MESIPSLSLSSSLVSEERINMASSAAEATDVTADVEAIGEVWNHTLSFIIPMSVKCAIELGVPNVIHAHGGVATLTQLAADLSIPNSKLLDLRRLMRLLVHVDYFTKQGDGDKEAYALTRLSRLLVGAEGTPASHFVLVELNPILLQPWDTKSAWFRQGALPSPFHETHGKDVFDVVLEQQEWAVKVDALLAGDSAMVGEALVKVYPKLFDGVKSTVEVAGRSGNIAAAIAKAFPHIKCSVLDLPHVAAKVAAEAESKGKLSNLEYIGGDMFDNIPSADLLVLKWVLMQWMDEDCLKILKRCKEAVHDRGGKLLIIEMVLHGAEVKSMQRETQLLFDMLLMCAKGGRQREEHEWRQLFTEAGFTNYTITPFGYRSLIEIHP